MYIRKLAKELDGKGIKKKDIPNKIGISYASVINYLTGKRIMPIDVFLNIINTYKIDIRSILGEEYFISDSNNPEKKVETAEITKLNLQIFELKIRLDECRKGKEGEKK